MYSMTSKHTVLISVVFWQMQKNWYWFKFEEVYVFGLLKGHTWVRCF
jgi:hypothetical protein